uniref:U6 small nuclear RNA (adenine-(43)-N(6))-methyltransferase n=1 Tax=Gongylonema pulchrum TaxID=637853 RepID=A0A183DYD8_9BILA
LVPRIPQRLNYILWLDDLLKANSISENALGIDIELIHIIFGAIVCIGFRIIFSFPSNASYLTFASFLACSVAFFFVNNIFSLIKIRIFFQLKMNFHDSDAVRILARTLLLNDFDLDVELPANCLVPRIPQRLNYILWLDDLLKANSISENALGIDIGTGASCVYALLGARQCGWRFLATDADPSAVQVATANVQRNNLSERIEVVRVNADNMIKEIVRSRPDADFTFCMCNPPFYEYDEFEEKYAYLTDDVTTNAVDRPDRRPPHSATIGKSSELASSGGEVAFVGRLIEDSFVLQNAVRLYTTMVGKKSSLTELRKKLRRCVNVRLTVTTLCQGRTHRWVLAWTFESRIKLDKLADCTPPLELGLPHVLEGRESSIAWIRKILALLEISCEKQENDVFFCEAMKNTWSQQRQKRRAERALASLSAPPASKRFCFGRSSIGCTAELGSGDGKDSLSEAGNHIDCLLISTSDANKRDASVQV